VKPSWKNLTLYPEMCGNVNLRSTLASLRAVMLYRVPGGKDLLISDLRIKWKLAAPSLSRFIPEKELSVP
jgi:hypothetical protein